MLAPLVSHHKVVWKVWGSVLKIVFIQKSTSESAANLFQVESAISSLALSLSTAQYYLSWLIIIKILMPQHQQGTESCLLTDLSVVLKSFSTEKSKLEPVSQS